MRTVYIYYFNKRMVEDKKLSEGLHEVCDFGFTFDEDVAKKYDSYEIATLDDLQFYIFEMDNTDKVDRHERIICKDGIVRQRLYEIYNDMNDTYDYYIEYVVGGGIDE